MRNGRQVAVKVQRPGIRDSIVQDLEILGDVAEFYDNHTEAGRKYEYGKMLDEFRRTILDGSDIRWKRQFDMRESSKVSMCASYVQSIKNSSAELVQHFSIFVFTSGLCVIVVELCHIT